MKALFQKIVTHFDSLFAFHTAFMTLDSFVFAQLRSFFSALISHHFQSGFNHLFDWWLPIFFFFLTIWSPDSAEYQSRLQPKGNISSAAGAKTCNLRARFLFACVPLVREPLAPLCAAALPWLLELAHARAVPAQRRLHRGLRVLSYIGWSLPPGQKAI